MSRISDVDLDDLKIWLIHAGLMLFGLILILSGLIIARKKKNIKKWVAKHKFIGIFGVFSFLAGLGMAVRMVGEEFTNHINSIHSIFGVISISYLYITPLIGQTIFWSVKIKSLSKRVKLIRVIHRWVGRTTILIVLGTIILGLFRAYSLIDY